MSFTPLCRRFAADRTGAVAMVFAFSLIPSVMAVGAAVDYSRASTARIDLQSAVDAAALAVGRAAIDTGRTDNRVHGRQAFDANFRPVEGTTVIRFDVAQDSTRILVEAEARVPLMFAGLLRMDRVDIGAKAEVPLSSTRIEVALVLDNTGSMASNGKMTALKTAAKNLITTLQNASTINTLAEVAVVPFDTQVSVWDVEASPKPKKPKRKKPKKKKDGGDEEGDAIELPSWVRIAPNDPNPKLRVTEKTWDGCIFDRDQNYDVRGTLPSAGTPATLHPAALCQAPDLLTIIPLNREFADLRQAIDEMTPSGNTNTSIGLAWGLSVLTPGAPLSATARHAGLSVKKHIIFLTDGYNTENRWTSNAAQIDQRTALLCREIRESGLGITLHTIRLIEGNESLLSNCASPGKYYSVTEASQLDPVFKAIATELLTLRLGR